MSNGGQLIITYAYLQKMSIAKKTASSKKCQKPVFYSQTQYIHMVYHGHFFSSLSYFILHAFKYNQ